MATLYHVSVAGDYRWPRVRVGGREFSKSGELISGDVLTEEMRRSPLLVLEEIEAPVDEKPDPEDFAPVDGEDEDGW